MENENSFWGKFKTFSIYAGPSTFAFLTVMIIPFIYGIYLTFTSWDGLSDIQKFVGNENYIAVFKDTVFWTSLWLTVKYVAVTVIITNVMAFLLAYVLTTGMKGQNIYRAGFFTPNLIGGIILGFIWKFVFSNILVYIGTNFDLPFFSSSWLADPKKAFWTLVIVTVWQYSGYMMIIYVAGFMNVPKDILEAASIDGASGFKKMKSIILPMMVPSFTVCLFLSIQKGFMAYDVNLALTGGGPYHTTELISMHVYNKAFLSQQYGTGQAEALILFIIVATITLIQVNITKKMEVEA
ncbi:carbohydrate ABC transporter permease [Clostridium sp.]|uniref:carbohydrate ABC transporter permease n=1 Tax=Clostridium sp. TaxID=1506 RepID=UPI003D6D5C38